MENGVENEEIGENTVENSVETVKNCVNKRLLIFQAVWKNVLRNVKLTLRRNAGLILIFNRSIDKDGR